MFDFFVCLCCGMENIYFDGVSWICLDCVYEWLMYVEGLVDEDVVLVCDVNG